MSHVCDWREGKDSLQLGIVLGLGGQHCERHCRAHRMADVDHLGSGTVRSDARLRHLHLDNVIDNGRNVVHAHLVPAKVPELVVALREIRIAIRVGVAANVAQPHVVADLGQQEGERVVRAADHPVR